MQLADPDEALRDKDFFSFPFNLPIAAHPAHLVVGVVPGVLQARRPGSGRGLVMLGGRSLVKGLVGTLVIEVVAEAVKALLLLGDGSGPPGGGVLLGGVLRAPVAA